MQQPITTLIPPDVRWAQDRNDWVRKYGEQPPPFDPSRPRQAWAFSNGGEPADIGYLTYNPVTAEVITRTISQKHAYSPNLPGEYQYAKYDPPVAGSTPVVSKWNLCDKADADLVVEELRSQLKIRVSDPFEAKTLGGQVIQYGPNETRRQWMIFHSGNVHSVGLLLASRYDRGVGNPNGHWEMADELHARWFYDAPVVDNNLEWLSYPIRAPKDDERIELVFSVPTLVTGTPSEPTGGVGSQEIIDRLAAISRQLDEQLALLGALLGG